MTTMISVRLNARQRQRLESQARKLGVSSSEIVRQWVDSLEEEPLAWDEILKDVRAASAKIKAADRIPNPVIAARRKRSFDDHLR